MELQDKTCYEKAIKTNWMGTSLPEQKEAQTSDSCTPYIVIDIRHLKNNSVLQYPVEL
jgi:hypothetical protein